MKIVTVLGARPQFIKAAAVSRCVARAPGVTEVLVHTGQHYDANMSDVFFAEMGIPAPAYHLGVGSGGHGAQTGRMLGAVEEVLLQERPDWLLVYGDTNSTLAGALAAVKLHIPVAHVEAGLRSFNRRMPEEVNRVLTDHSADILFAPTRTAVENLRQEGVAAESIVEVGDVMYDAARFFGAKAAGESAILQRLGLGPKEYVLATVHRAENTDDPARLRAVIDGLKVLADERPVVLPLHPRTRAALERFALDTGNVHVVEPLGYLDMVMLEMNAAMVATDSGGVQKEAFFHGVPCVTLRDETEWVELVELGWNRLLPPTSTPDLGTRMKEALDTQGAAGAPYGDGHAAEKIVRHLSSR